MRPTGVLLLLIGLALARPAIAEPGNDAPPVTVLRGASAPPAAAPSPPPVVVQTVVYPEVVYVPTYYYPAYLFYYPGYFVQPRQFARQQASATALAHGHK